MAEKLILVEFYSRNNCSVCTRPTIFISNDLGVIGDACSINYRISDSDSSVRFKIIEK